MRRLPFLPEATRIIAAKIYDGQPVQLYIREKRARNQQIRRLFDDGVSMHQLSIRFGISEQRVHQLIHGR
jgi:hypothetical protein